jgi:hypothetical protein
MLKYSEVCRGRASTYYWQCDTRAGQLGGTGCPACPGKEVDVVAAGLDKIPGAVAAASGTALSRDTKPTHYWVNAHRCTAPATALAGALA